MISRSPKSGIRLAVFTDRSADWPHRLHSSGIEVNYFPLITFSSIKTYREPLLTRWRELIDGKPGYLLFTSGRAVNYFAEIIAHSEASPISPLYLGKENLGKENFSRVITVGPNTLSVVETALGKFGITAGYHADTQGVGEGQRGVWELIHSQKLTPILHIRPVAIDDFLEQQCHRHSVVYESFPVYQTIPVMLKDEMKEEVLKCDYLLFTSSSIIRTFWDNFKNYKRYLGEGISKFMFPPALLIGKSSENTFQEIADEFEKTISLKSLKDQNQSRWRKISLLPGKNLEERIVKTLGIGELGENGPGRN